MASSRAERRPSLVRRLTRLSVGVLAAALLVSALALAAWVHLTLRDAQLRVAEQSAQFLAESLAPALAFQDRPATQAALLAFSRRADLRALQVWLPGGEPFAQWPREAEAKRLSPAQAQAVQLDWAGLRLVVPVMLQGERMASLAWSESFESLNATLVRLALGGLAVVALALLGASLLLRWSQRRALAPLIALSRLAERVAAEQDYGLRAEVKRQDEVGRLAERFNGMLRRIEVWHQDMSQQLAQEQQAGRVMRQLAHRDALTGLPNRLAFELSLERQTLDLTQGGERVALLFVDLDHFKRVNDSQGHAAGDEVLIEVGRRMGAVLRATDTLFRLGGDEFALIVTAVVDAATVEHLAERLIACVREPLLVQGRRHSIGASIGLAIAPDDAADPQTLLQAADGAMYAAKHAGKNTFRRAPRAPRDDPDLA